MDLKLELIRMLSILMNGKETSRKLMENPERGGKPFAAEKFSNEFQTVEWKVDGRQIITIKNDKCMNKHVVLLHGSAYTVEAQPGHKKMVEKLVKKYHLKVTFLDYPKQPEFHGDYTLQWTMRAYEQICEKYPDDELMLFGDSAGGGLATILLQQLRLEGKTRIPRRTILMCPWVDISLSNPAIKKYEAVDPMLPFDALLKAARTYAGDLDLKNPILSPIYGDLSNLGKLLILTGTREILHPDIMKFAAMARREEGTSVGLLVGEGLCHDWILTSCRLTDKTIDKFARFYFGELRY